MKDEWFRWEREAAIHLLFPTLEGSMQPLKSFTGHGFPTTILVFKNGIVTWCVKENEFYGLGAKLLEIYKDHKKEKQMVNETTKRLNLLVKVEKEIDKTKLSKLSNKSLANLYSKLHESFINYYGIGAIQEPLAMQAEIELKNSNTSLSDNQISSLTTPTKKSYIKEVENYLWQTKNIENFIKKYYWLDNNYSQTKILSKTDVKQKLKHIKKSKKLSPLSIGDFNLSPETTRLVELLKNFAAYQDERKRNILIYLHFLEILLKEIGRRGSIDLKTMRDTFPTEVVDILNGKISKDAIKKRRESCFVVWKEKSKRPLILIGKNAKKWEEKLSPRINLKTQIVKGSCASKGKAKGKVRVLLNASENNKLKKGEVLVTFMTSPDFMSAIKRCSAIVTNLGGITSHAAIISREFGIPCVVGTKNATEILKTGDLVEVDADKGIVRIVK
jgi:phosphohistidine swiveling domain-containing protein